MTLWLIEANQNRRRLIDRSFQPCFYVHGPAARLARLGQALAARARVACGLTERTDIWEGEGLRVLQVTVHHPTQFAALGRFVHRYDSALRLYNSDLMLAPLYCWEKEVFPLAKVELEVETPRWGVSPVPAGKCVETAQRAVSTVRAIECRDDTWATDYELPPLRVMRVRLEGLAQVDPQHGRRGALEVEIDGEWRVLDDSEEPVAAGFARLLRTHDPDLIVSEWGDSTLFPGLLRQASKGGLELPLNRDPVAPVARSRARSYTSYGRILFKGSTTTLFGRLHVDAQNSFIADQCNLEGLWELVRVTKLPVQYCARTTTGTGISYMQMELAYRDGVLIPEQKAEPESPKHPDELLRADRGGLVIPPRLGFFTGVAELDFVSEFPSIMARFNVSPETVNCRCCPEAPRVPELGYRVCQRRRGITSRVVERLIKKRQQYKQLMSEGGEEPGEGRPNYKLRRSALKWLLVCCFGYTGYKNARFGKIEAHESINALAREKLLVAKETAEQQGFRILYALVDSLYVQKEGARREDYERLGQEIEQRTGLPMALEAVYRYVVFLPSKQHAEIPVPNRFFCVPEEGEVKIRGLECRKHDTAPLVARMQREALKILSEARDFRSYSRKLEEARAVLERYLARLESGGASVEELVISRRLTRSPRDYQHASATAIAAKQLDRSGVQLRPGEMIEYIITDADSNYPDDRVRALTLWEGWRGYDVKKYQEVLREAFEPFEHFAASGAT
jgi:DNA polymerase-2